MSVSEIVNPCLSKSSRSIEPISSSLPVLRRPEMLPRLQHLRNLRRHGLMDRRRRMQRVVPEILFQLHAALHFEIVLLVRRLVLLAIVLCVAVAGCLGVGCRVVDDVVEEGVGIEVEDGGVGVCEGQVGGEG